jgi:acyl-CoA thioesterase FadM
MNLYFRLLLILFKSAFAGQIRVLDESLFRFRVWPFDCDINFHLTNARYFALCDLSRVYYMAQVGVLFKLLKRNWLPIVQSQEISYFKSIKPFQSVEVLTCLTYWDDKYWYTEHRFVAGDRLCAVVQVRGVFMQARNVVSMHDVIALTGEDVKAPDKTINVELWQNLIKAKKEDLKGFRS